MEMNANFDGLAEHFYAFGEDTRGLYAPWLEEHSPGGRRALDLGCGYGRFTGLLGARYEEVLAVDIAASWIEMARTENPYPNVDYQLRSLLGVSPESDGHFDLVLAVNVLHHAGRPQKILPHVKSLVNPGGHALLIDIVDTAPSGARATRKWHEEEAFRDAQDSYTNPRRSRSPDVAAKVLRLRLDERWLDIVTRHQRMNRREFHETYGAVFPGAVFDDEVHRVACAMHWTRPLRERAQK